MNYRKKEITKKLMNPEGLTLREVRDLKQELSTILREEEKEVRKALRQKGRGR